MNNTRETRQPVGVISGESRPSSFIFTLNPSAIILLHDYVYFEVDDTPPGMNKPVRVKVVAQVQSLRRIALGVAPEHPWQVLEKMSIPGGDTVIAYARVLGYKWRGSIHVPRRAPPIGSRVYYAPDSLLAEFFSVDKERRIHIGYLVSRPSVPAYLDLEGIKRHIAIIAATGAGKTWASIVLIEELLKKGATIVVLDPHGEYTSMKTSIHRLGSSFRESVRIVKGHRDQEGDIQYRIGIPGLSADELADAAGVPKKATKIRAIMGSAKIVSEWLSTTTRDSSWIELDGIIRVLQEAIDVVEKSKLSKSNGLSVFGRKLIGRLLGLGNGNGPSNSYVKLAENNKKLEKALRLIWLSIERDSSPGYDAIRYLEELKKIGVYSSVGTPLSEIVAPSSVTIVNLAGLRNIVQDHIAYDIMKRLFEARIRFIRRLGGESYQQPVVIIMEEAHRFIPPRGQSQTKTREIASQIASEGRKFGVYMVVITQRPSRIDQDVLSQMQNQIILRIVNPRDQEAVRDSSEQLSQDLLENLPGLNRGEAVIVGPMTSAPLMIRLRDRVLEYSGQDIDLVDAWSRVKELETEHLLLEREILARLSRVASRRYEDIPSYIGELLGVKPSSREVVDALEYLRSGEVWVSQSYDPSVLFGEVIYRGEIFRVKTDLGEKFYKCSCRAERVCSHVVALLLKAIIDGLVESSILETRFTELQEIWGERY